jgi:hypothetical protein
VHNPLYAIAQDANATTVNDMALTDEMKPADSYYDNVKDSADRPLDEKPVYEEVKAPRERPAEDHHYDIM